MKFIDYNNYRKGKVTVLNKEYDRIDDKIIMLCKCDCGNIFTVKRTTFLSDGFKGHCGCEKHRNSKDSTLPKLVRQYKKDVNIPILTEYEKKMLDLKNICADIKEWFTALRAGTENCKIGAIIYVK